MRTRVCSLLVLPAIILVIALAIMAVFREQGGQASAQDGPTLALDMDITDGGPCANIESTATHDVGDQFGVGVCLVGASNTQVAAFQFDVQYDPAIDYAPPGNSGGPSLDSNPDANAGTTTWAGGLGSGFDCSATGLVFPTVGDGRAYLSCFSAPGPYATAPDPVALGVVNFQALTAGQDAMTIIDGDAADSDANIILSCDDQSWQSCFGGTSDDIECPADGCPTATPVPTATPLPTATFTPAPPADTDKDGIPDVSDKCPLNAEDKDGFQDSDGCPDPDNDADGVADWADKCPNVPGQGSADGCPDVKMSHSFYDGAMGLILAMDFNPNTHRLYVGGTTYVESETKYVIQVIDTDTETVVQTIPIPRRVAKIKVDPVANRIYVIDWYDENYNGPWWSMPGGVTVLDGETNDVIATLPTGQLTSYVAINHVDNHVYVFSNSLYIFDATTYQQLVKEVCPGGPIEVDPVSGDLYIAWGEYYGDPPSWDAAVMIMPDATLNRPYGCQMWQPTVPISPGGPTATALDPSTGLLFISEQGNDSLSIFDTKMRQEISSIPVGHDPRAIAFDPQTNRVYVSNFGSKSISVVDVPSRSVISTISMDDPDNEINGTLVMAVDAQNGVVYSAITDVISVFKDTDWDNDGILANADNCPYLSNPDQADSDGEGVGDVCDNCPTVANPDQKHTLQHAIDNGPVVRGDDLTVPLEDSVGDACKTDSDNDALRDALEQQYGGSTTIVDDDAASDGVESGLASALSSSASLASADSTKAGAEALPGASVGMSNAYSSVDSDHDGLPDALEAQIGTDPHNRDTDGDGISDGVEFWGWGSSPLMKDTDADGCPDNVEMADVNGDYRVNTTDLLIEARVAGGTIPFNADFDLAKDGRVNTTDLLVDAKQLGRSCAK